MIVKKMLRRRLALDAGKLVLALVLFAGLSLSGCGGADTEQTWEELPEIVAESVGTGAGEDESAVSENDSAGNGVSENAISGNDAGAEKAQDGEGDAAAMEERPKVRGIYVTGPMAGTSNMDELIDLADRTELNALVIDIKNDEGYVVCDMDAPLVSEIGSVKRYVKDMPALVQKCKEKNIYLIARVVAFKDPFLAEAKPEWSLHNADGSIFRDKSGLAWVNPYERGVWDYLVEVAKGAIALGFDEVQFDYIRFSTDSGMKNVDFGIEAQEKSREDIITEFAAYAADALHEAGAAVSADVYGVVIDSEVDQQTVGQNYRRLAEHMDYLSPMVYPSHYGPYNYGIPVPDAQPYETVLAAMQSSKKVLAGINPKEEQGEEEASGDGSVSENEAGAGSEGTDAGSSAEIFGGEKAVSAGISEGADVAGVSGNSAVSGNDLSEAMTAEQIAALEPLPEIRADVRPWLQDFTASWVTGHISYGPEEIRAQIQAVYDAGYDEWILWNAANRYTEGGLLGPEEE